MSLRRSPSLPSSSSSDTDEFFDAVESLGTDGRSSIATNSVVVEKSSSSFSVASTTASKSIVADQSSSSLSVAKDDRGGGGAKNELPSTPINEHKKSAVKLLFELPESEPEPFPSRDGTAKAVESNSTNTKNDSSEQATRSTSSSPADEAAGLSLYVARNNDHVAEPSTESDNAESEVVVDNTSVGCGNRTKSSSESECSSANGGGALHDKPIETNKNKYFEEDTLVTAPSSSSGETMAISLAKSLEEEVDKKKQRSRSSFRIKTCDGENEPSKDGHSTGARGGDDSSSMPAAEESPENACMRAMRSLCTYECPGASLSDTSSPQNAVVAVETGNDAGRGGRPVYGRSNSFLTDLLSQPGGKLTSTARTDPRLPPSSCPPPLDDSSGGFLTRNSPTALLRVAFGGTNKRSSFSSPGSVGSDSSQTSSSHGRRKTRASPVGGDSSTRGSAVVVAAQHRRESSDSNTTPSQRLFRAESSGSGSKRRDSSSHDGPESSSSTPKVTNGHDESWDNSSHSKQRTQSLQSSFSSSSVNEADGPPGNASTTPPLSVDTSRNGESKDEKQKHKANRSRGFKTSVLRTVIEVNKVKTKTTKESSSRKFISLGKRMAFGSKTKTKSLPSSTSLAPTVFSTPKPEKHLSSVIPSNAVPVKAKGRNSANSLSDPMLRLQNIPSVHSGAIWCCAFCPDGKYLATGGEDKQILVFEVNPTNKEPSTETESSSTSRNVRDEFPTWSSSKRKSSSSYNLGTEIQLLSQRPVQTFSSHAGDIIDLSWSKSRNSLYFLLSASVDKTVRLWHVSRPDSILTFQHSDLVTSVDFHPTNENFFLSAGFDKKLRLWHIPGERVREWAKAPEIITKARFTPDGKFVVAGLITGQVYFYSCLLDGIISDHKNHTFDRQAGGGGAYSSTGNGVNVSVGGSGNSGFRYYTQFACRNRYGKNVGKKVTGLAFIGGQKYFRSEVSYDDDSDGRGDEESSNVRVISEVDQRTEFSVVDQLLVSTNDSRMRLYGMDDFCMIRKYKGVVNTSYMINAHFSESGDHIISGSEVGNVYIWDTDPKRRTTGTTAKGDAEFYSPRGKTGKQHIYDRNKLCEWFEVATPQMSSSNSPPVPSVVTDAHFVPSRQLEEAFLKSNLFPTLKSFDDIKCDMSSSMVVTCDYNGTVKVFLRKSCFDAMVWAAGPEGNHSV